MWVADGGTSACADPEESDSGTGAPQRCFGVCNRDETEDVAVAIEVSGLTLEDAVLAKHDVLVALLASEYAMEIGTDGEGSASGAAATDGVPATDFSASISVSEGMTESSVVITGAFSARFCDSTLLTPCCYHAPAQFCCTSAAATSMPSSMTLAMRHSAPQSRTSLPLPRDPRSLSPACAPLISVVRVVLVALES